MAIGVALLFFLSPPLRALVVVGVGAAVVLIATVRPTLGRVATAKTVRGANFPTRLLAFVPSVLPHRLTRGDGRVVVVAPVGSLSLSL
jgi:hypothetical protein